MRHSYAHSKPYVYKFRLGNSILEIPYLSCQGKLIIIDNCNVLENWLEDGRKLGLLPSVVKAFVRIIHGKVWWISS